MIRETIYALLVVGTLTAQTLPKRPEQIVFKNVSFAAPRSENFRAQLQNGIPVYIAANPEGLPFVRITATIKGGSYMDPKGREGLAEIMGNLMRGGGTAKIPADTLDDRLEFIAGNITSQMGDTTGMVTMTFLEKDFKEGLDLFMQVLTQPAFAQDRLDQLKEEIQQNIQGRNDNVSDIARTEFPRILNGQDHFTSALPTAASLKAISREDLQSFHARLMHPANIVISVSGKFKREAMLENLNQALGTIKPGPKAVTSPRVPAPDIKRKPGIYLIDKDVPQSMIAFALPGLRRTDPDWYAAFVMNQLLGGSGFTSRLMMKLRSDEGLTYGIETQFGDGIYWRGDWYGFFQTKNRSVPNALRLVLAEIDRIKKTPVYIDELTVIKDGIIQAFPAKWGQKALVVNAFAQEESLGWPENWWADFREKIQAVTAEDVQRVARKYLDSNQLVVLVIGNVAEVEAGDAGDNSGHLKDVAPLPMVRLPLRDPLTLEPIP